jgi:hypothetical protein
VVAVVLVFEEGKLSGLVEDDDRSSVLEVVVAVDFFLPSPSWLLVPFLVVVLDCIDLIRKGRSCSGVRYSCLSLNRN